MKPVRETASLDNVEETYRAVFFDLGGTLFSYRDAGRHTVALLVEAAGRLGRDVAPRTAGAAYRSASRASALRYSDQPFYLHRDLFRDTFRGFAHELDRVPTEPFLDWFEDAQRAMLLETMTPRRDCLETLEKLRARGLYLSIVSNIDDDYLVPLVEKWKLDQVLDDWTSSEGARSCKPDPEFFALALAKARCQAERVVFVGDSPEHDIAGARAAGMTTVLISEAGTTPPLQSGNVTVAADHQIATLSELLPLVE